MFSLTKKKILLTGGHGFVGKHVLSYLKKEGLHENQIVIPDHTKQDLRDMSVCMTVTQNIDIVIHLAGNVGGIGYNQKNPGSLFFDNIALGINLIEASRLNQVKKFVCVGTVCSYPKVVPIPFQEKNLWSGYPEETNAPYGIAKKALLVMLDAYRKQYNFNGIYLIPVNMYGPGDTFSPQRSHVIPAIIRKVYEAKKTKKDFINVWGDGQATREFLYVKDFAEAIILATKKYNKPDPLNIGTGVEISIYELTNKIVNIMEYTGKIVWDSSKPNGQPRRCIDISKAVKELNFVSKTSFNTGLLETIQWYIQAYG